MTENVALTIARPGEARLEERPFPKIIPGYAVVAVAYAGICGEERLYLNDEPSELLPSSPNPVFDARHLGHEGVGTVVEVAEGTHYEVGDRVIIYYGDHCGRCYACRNSLSSCYCVRTSGPTGTGLFGLEAHNGSDSGGFGMERYRIGAEPNLYKIPDELEFRYAAAAACLLGCTYTAQEEIGIKPGETVLVGGIGFIGLGHIINALYRNAKVIALVRNAYRAELCRELGVQHIVDPDEPDWLEQVKVLTTDDGVDAAFESSGAPYYIRRCIDAVRFYGRVHCTGNPPHTPFEVAVREDLNDRHLTLMGGHDVRTLDRDGLMQMLLDPDVQRGVDVAATHELPMSEGDEALRIAASKECGKVYVLPQK